MKGRLFLIAASARVFCVLVNPLLPYTQAGSSFAHDVTVIEHTTSLDMFLAFFKKEVKKSSPRKYAIS